MSVCAEDGKDGSEAALSPLVAILRSFDRKERNWLLRQALGSVPLSDAFRHELSGKLGLEVETDAWWAIDFHLDWIVASIVRFLEETPPYAEKGEIRLRGGLITGSQEDGDLIIAFGSTIILVEAKGEMSWGRQQLRSKLSRMAGIRDLLAGYGDVGRSIAIHQVLASPGGLAASLTEEVDEWASGQQTHHLSLFPPQDELWQVERWHEQEARPHRDGDHWRMVRSRRKTPNRSS